MSEEQDEIEGLLEVLASLGANEYEKLRAEAADTLGWRTRVLDREVERIKEENSAATGAQQGHSLKLSDPEPWPEPVNGVEALDEIVSTLNRYVVLPSEAANAAALWVFFSYAIDFASHAPRLHVKSPEPRCGKTTLLTLIGWMVPRALHASNISTAAVFRTIEVAKPTLLIDEADSFVTSKDELRGIINSGHARDYAFVIRCVGDDAQPQRFSTWAAIAFGSIGKLQATIEDRSVSIPLRRRMSGEQIEKLPRNGSIELSDLRARCARWVQDHREELLAADPNIPDGLNDRAADNWRLMIAVADLAGADWPSRARAAALELSGPGVTEDESSVRVQLLADLRDIFAAEERDQLTSECLVECLVGLEERPWPEWGKSAKPLTKRQLARLLNPFDIRPCNIWVGDRPLKGYKRVDFEDAFARYLPSAPTARSLEPARNSGPAATLDALGISAPSVSKNTEKRRSSAAPSGLADRKGGAAGEAFRYVDDPNEVVIRHARGKR